MFGDSALCSSVIGKSWETISLHTQSVWCNVFKGAEEGPKRNVDISLVLEAFLSVGESWSWSVELSCFENVVISFGF